MRPVRLSMQAFASYGSRCEISFEVPQQNLFLVTGDTGAGKSTIFDAIVFALYGEASSSANRKDGIVLQSQYVGADVEPFVELTFEEKGLLYTIRRVPRHMKLLKRGAAKGTGTREINGSVSLTEPDGTVYPSKETDARIVEIIGLSKDQFMQVAMIAQGEFMQLLRAKSDDKKLIFRRLFGTQVYQQVTAEIADRRKEMDKQLDQMRAVCLSAAAGVPVTPRSDPEGTLAVLKAGCENGSVTGLTLFTEALEMRSESQRLEVDELKKQSELCAQERDRCSAQLAKAQQLLKMYEALEQADGRLRELENKKEEILQTENLIPKIRAAWKIQETFDRACEAKKRAQLTQTELSARQEELPVLKEQVEQCTRTEQAAAKHFAEQTAQDSRLTEQMTKALETLARVEETKAQAQRSSEHRKAADLQSEKSKAQADKCESELESKRQEIAALADVPGKLERAKAEQEKAANLLTDVQELKKLRADGQAQAERKNKARQRYIASGEAYQKIRAQYENARIHFLDNQAGLLARELKEGQRCPVCGSCEHPHPAHLTGGEETITRVQLDALAEQAEVARIKQEKDASESSVQKDLLDEKVRQFKEAWDKFVQRASESAAQITDQTSLDAAGDLVSARIKETEDKLREAVRDDAALRRLRTEIEKKEKELPELKAKAEQDMRSAMDARSQESAAQAAYAQLQESVSVSSRKEIQERLSHSHSLRDEAQKQLKKAQTDLKAASARADACTALVDKLQRQMPELLNEVQNRTAQYEASMTQEKLTEADWKAICQAHPLQTADAWTEQVSAYRTELAAVDAARRSALTQIGEAEKPVPGQAETSLEEAKRTWEQAARDAEQAARELHENLRALEILKPRLEEIRSVSASQARLSELYRRLSGNVKDGRMDIETYVQRFYLEKILHAANRRFTEMSAGQFELRMVNETAAGQGRNRGLDLMVYSCVTGKEREIRTLSGGESFMAALSLALGMSDQIQMRSAAIHPDIMFIDEGFGSLDDHARDQAVRVLREMAGGSRMIGIISHVSELKTQIEDHLLVTRDEHGSHVRWEVG